MINGFDACAQAIKLLGIPYEECDCNMLLIRIIREAPGGDKTYRCANVDWLYHSIENAGKYRYITTREKIASNRSNCTPGQFVARVSGDKCYHMGMYMGGYNGYEVIHSPHSGRTVEGTTIDKSGFNYVLTSKFIKPQKLSTNTSQPVDKLYYTMLADDFEETNKIITENIVNPALIATWEKIKERTLSDD